MSGIPSGRHTAWKRNKEMYVLPRGVKGICLGSQGRVSSSGNRTALYKIFVLK